MSDRNIFDHPAFEDDSTKLSVTPSEDGESITVERPPILDGPVLDEVLELMVAKLPAAELPPGEFDEEEMMGNLTASKFLLLDKDNQLEQFYSGFLAGGMGIMTLLSICAPGVTNSPRLALLYRVLGLVGKHLKELRENGPKKN